MNSSWSSRRAFHDDDKFTVCSGGKIHRYSFSQTKAKRCTTASAFMTTFFAIKLNPWTMKSIHRWSPIKDVLLNEMVAINIFSAAFHATTHSFLIIFLPALTAPSNWKLYTVAIVNRSRIFFFEIPSLIRPSQKVFAWKISSDHSLWTRLRWPHTIQIDLISQLFFCLNDYWFGVYQKWFR